MNSDAVPQASSWRVLQRMRSVRHRDTAPEVAVKRELDRLGLVYTAHERPEPSIARLADILFRDCRVAVFVDGCFWHSCPTHASKPKSNSSWWVSKLKANQLRDQDTGSRLLVTV